MQTGSRDRSDAATTEATVHAEALADDPPAEPAHPFWTAAAATTTGAWLGMIVSVLGWFDEPLEIWFQISKLATAVGACTGLGLAATLTAVRAHHRRTNQSSARLTPYDVFSPQRG
ncbi:hypothetical protein [Kribbella sp. ALI-6-A]|uniref:hypothetical protein n=1 Tax=Kribbella sp. ALI-6-A TaxID=1933817 RepID=UPI00143DB396|nr:hypothetical protein [Kribbella sp. ALI-6-A]